MQQRHFDHFLDPLLLTIALLCKVRGEPRPIKCDLLTVRRLLRFAIFCYNIFTAFLVWLIAIKGITELSIINGQLIYKRSLIILYLTSHRGVRSHPTNPPCIRAWSSCDILTKNNILLVPNLYNNYSGLVKRWYFVKVVASYALAKKRHWWVTRY